MKTQMDVLPLAVRLRLAQAVRESVKDDKRLTTNELISNVAPLFDEFKIPAEQGAALLDEIVQRFNDGSVVDAEAQKILAAASAKFELGTDPVAELSRLIDAIRHDAQDSTRPAEERKQATKTKLLNGLREITSRPALIEQMRKAGSLSVELPPGLEPTLFSSSMYAAPQRATRGFLVFGEGWKGKVKLEIGVPFQGDFHRYEADFYPVDVGVGKLLERSPIEAGAAFAESLLRAIRASL